MRYLIIKTSAFGDVVQTLPILHYLKQTSADVQVDWVVEEDAAPLLKAHPLVDRVIIAKTKKWRKTFWKSQSFQQIRQFVAELRQEKYDAVFDLQSNSKSAIITLISRAKSKVGFGWKSARERINCMVTTQRCNPPKGQNVRRDYLSIIQNYFQDNGSIPSEEVELKLSEIEIRKFENLQNSLPASPIWMVCPGSAWKNKQLSQESLKTFLTDCNEFYKPNFIFIYGNDKEKEFSRELARYFPTAQVIGGISLAVLQHLMAKMQLVIAMDSLPLHLAATTGVATFSFFGPTVSHKFRPMGSQHGSYQGNCPFGITFDKQCPQLRSCKTAPCVNKVDSVAVFQTFSGWWNQLISASKST